MDSFNQAIQASAAIRARLGSDNNRGIDDLTPEELDNLSYEQIEELIKRENYALFGNKLSKAIVGHLHNGEFNPAEKECVDIALNHFGLSAPQAAPTPFAPANNILNSIGNAFGAVVSFFGSLIPHIHIKVRVSPYEENSVVGENQNDAADIA